MVEKEFSGGRIVTMRTTLSVIRNPIRDKASEDGVIGNDGGDVLFKKEGLDGGHLLGERGHALPGFGVTGDVTGAVAERAGIRVGHCFSVGGDGAGL